MQHENKRAISIANLVENMWLYIYPRPAEITYDQGLQFNGQELRKPLIEEECGILSNPRTLGYKTSNATLKRIHAVLGNLVHTYNIKNTYMDEDDPWSGILAAESFKICSTVNRLKCYIPLQLLFGHDMIIPIKYTVYWELICD